MQSASFVIKAGFFSSARHFMPCVLTSSCTTVYVAHTDTHRFDASLAKYWQAITNFLQVVDFCKVCCTKTLTWFSVQETFAPSFHVSSHPKPLESEQPVPINANQFMRNFTIPGTGSTICCPVTLVTTSPAFHFTRWRVRSKKSVNFRVPE